MSDLTPFEQNKKFSPFYFVEHEDSFSCCLSIDHVEPALFEIFEQQDGFEGSGYDWGSVAQVVLDEQFLHLQNIVKFDPEGSMFCAYSDNKDALVEFIAGLFNVYTNNDVLRDILTRAELD